ncbi:MAG: 50S ribosomal protein L25 [Candidatus Scalindua rubra]|uniref:Large ribosomal subunit protein bL25 n=1 Tax=Candidatus Scalindua brodae TaxID=237368 RepID=A0A0B0EH05_9BACT|nr:MAG: 50S ribosomal protein L25 (TL5) [Candidatus Scalindua brodae]MBZ0109251.1 50S ribosomal protein L25 [Candidatus Scalindua rubra]TWU36830.1 50S ribosomal protein L25 [Candidatus Brocadiaceae bacterium S225]
METQPLQAKIRKDSGSIKSRKNRKAGLVPAVLYGHKQESIMLYLDKKEFSKLIDARTKMVNLKMGNSAETAIIKEVQFDTFGKEILHADFVRTDLTEKIIAHVPIVLYGTSKGVKEGGVLDHALKEVEIECLATAVPDNIRVNISELAIGDTIHIGDLELPANVNALGSTDAVVVSVHFAAEEEEEEEEGLASGPEIISARKLDKEKESENKD